MATPSNDPVVSLTDVFKTYKVGEVDVPAVKGVTFNIPRRRFSVIVGPSGSGKTTLLNLIGCLDTPTAGRVIIAGQDVAHADRQRDFRLSRTEGRLHFPELQPDSRVLGVRKHRVPASAVGRERDRTTPACDEHARSGGSGRPWAAAAKSVEWRPKATRRDRPCAREGT